MKRTVRLALLLAGIAAFAPAQALDLASQIAARLSPAQVVRGQFEQQKIISGFSKPLLSSGEFVLWKSRGVLWQTRKPFASTLKITRNTLQAWQDNPEQKSLQLDSRSEPALKAVNTLLFAIFSGDIKTLQHSFKMDGGLSGKQGWQLTLTANDAAVSRVIKSATLEGDRHVHVLTLLDSNGDKSIIRFSGLSEAEGPTATEAHSFAE